MTTFKLLMTAMFALVAGWFVESARADEAYVCEGGRIAYVKLGQLERMKRQDPCIASYYGVAAVQGAVVASPGASQAAPGRGAASDNSIAAAGGAAELQSAGGGSQRLKLINANESGRWFTLRQRGPLIEDLTVDGVRYAFLK